MNRCAVACGCLALVQATFAGSATWNYREGVGGSPANPTLWTDTANWTGGAVRLTGDTSKFTTGSYKLIASSGLIPGSEWTVDGYTGRKVLKLRVKADGLYLEVIEQGLSVVIR